ncbi:MAG: glutaredoxin domain-containing protein [Candidatus Neomarinimicrobiota bacterium]
MIKIYTIANCPSCNAAKRFLRERNQEYVEIDITTAGISRSDLEQLTGGRTVPQIVIDDNPIGGYDNLLALDQAGKLPF